MRKAGRLIFMLNEYVPDIHKEESLANMPRHYYTSSDAATA